MKKRIARVTIESERLLVISPSRRSIESWCDVCASAGTFVSIDEAAAVAGVSQRTIFRWAESGAIHLIETADGKAMFCLNSIAAHMNSNQRRLLRS